MSKINRRPVRRTAAGVLASALVLSGAVAAAVPAQAATGFALERIAGDDRYQTSARIAEAFGATSGAILASGEAGRSVDALSANFLAGVQGVPVLLTQRDSVPASVRARLNALTGAKNVTIVGGTVAVSAAVETELRTAGFTVTRLAGDDRYETSEAIITAGRASASPIGLVASGLSFPDALAGGPLAYAGKHPIFLTAGSTIPQDTIDAMVAAGTRQVIVLGGTAAVPASVETQLAARNITVVTRLGGAGRSETSRLVADYLVANAGFSTTTFNVASGAPRSEGVDALSGAALSGKQLRPLLITDTATSGAAVVAYATARANTLNAAGTIFGGTAAVAATVETAAETAGSATVSNQTFAVTPAGPATLTLADDDADTAAERDADNRQYVVTNPVAGAVHTIALFPASAVTVGANGVVTFLDDDATDDVADDLGDVDAVITVVNGAAQAADTRVAEVAPAGGQISFTVEGESDETVVPVVFFDADGGNDLDLGDNGAPVAAEAFGLGGATNFNPAASGTRAVAADEEITELDETANTFITSGGVHTYDDNDRYFIDADGGNDADFDEQVTLAEFEAQLSVGDEIAQNTQYNATAGFASTFILDDLEPGAPTIAVAPEADITDTSVTLTVTGATGPVTVYGVVDTGANAVVDTDDPVRGTAAADQDADIAGFQVVLMGLTPDTTYDFAAVQTVAGEVSELSNELENVATTPTQVRPTLTTSALTDDVVVEGAIDSGDVITLTFNRGVTVGAAGTAVLNLTDADGDAIRVSNGVAGVATDGVTEATIVASDESAAIAGTETVTVTLTEDAEDRNTAGDDENITYPATLTSVAGITDTATTGAVNIAGGDVTIS